MVPALYFGVELEFCLGYILPGMHNPDHNSDKFVEFTISDRSLTSILDSTLIRHQDKDKSRVTNSQLTKLGYMTQRYDAPELIRREFIEAAAREHIGQSFIDTKLPYERSADRLGSLDYWVIGKDDSIVTKDADPRYFWYPMEITSPAYLFNAESLDAVSNVCQILSTEYLTNLHPSCALHVHFSFGKKASLDDESTRWNFKRLKKLMMYFWACGPYFMAIHSPRYLADTQFAVPMRKASQLAQQLRCRKDGQSTEEWWLVQEGLEEIGKTKDLPRLMEICSRNLDARFMDVSILNIARVLHPEIKRKIWHDYDGPKKSEKPTVEFRQHEGTLDSGKVVNWIKTLAGVIRWVEAHDIDLKPEILITLVERSGKKVEDIQEETGSDTASMPGGTEAEPLAKQVKGLSIVDLLERMELQDEANYFRHVTSTYHRENDRENDREDDGKGDGKGKGKVDEKDGGGGDGEGKEGGDEKKTKICREHAL